MEGTSTAAPGKTRPRSPPLLPLALFSLYRAVLVCTVTALIHHFITTPFVAPAIFNLIRGPFIQNVVLKTVAMQWLVGSWVGARVASRGQDLTDMLFFGLGVSIVHGVVYFSLVGFFSACDKFNWLEKYRIPRDPAQAPSAALIRKTLFEGTLNAFVTGPMALCAIFVLFGKWKSVKSLDDLVKWDAPLHMQILSFLAMHQCNEIGFYFVHRAFHELPGFYAMFHKQHHNWLSPQAGGISAEYANPLEALTANIAPTVFYMLLMSHTMPVGVTYSWLAARLVETLEAHSSYDFRGTTLYQLGILHGSAAFHDWHHTKNRGAYGSPLLDVLFGTADAYLADTRKPIAPAQVDNPLLKC